MQPIQLPALSDEELRALDELYHTTHAIRLHTRAQIILLAAEQRLVTPLIGAIVRLDEQTVRRSLKRYLVEGIAELPDAPRPEMPKIALAYQERLLQFVRQCPRALGDPFSLRATQRLADIHPGRRNEHPRHC